MSDLSQKFEDAQERVKGLKSRPDSDALLELYSFYKQATAGDCNIPPPKGMFDLQGKAKHEAWSNRKGLSADKAMQQYIKLVDALVKRDHR